MKIRLLIAMATAAAMSVVALPATSARAAQPSKTIPTTGALPSPVPSATTPAVDDGKVLAIARVGSSIVIGGTFTKVAGTPRSRVASFDVGTGALGQGFAPGVDGKVNTVIPGPTATTVFIGGNFTKVGGTAATNVALLNLANGQVVTSFQPPATNWGEVRDLVLRGNRLYVGGTFTALGGKAHAGIASLNATTGALDPFMNVQLTGHHNDSGSGAQSALGVRSMAATADGTKMVVVGSFKYADGLLRDQVTMLNLSGGSAMVQPDWSTSRYSPLCFSWAFDDYVRTVAFSPDDSYFVVTATGGGNPGTLCDAVSRWSASSSGSDVQPTWVAETGGDTLWGAAVTDAAVFVGGHERWMNNPNGVDQPRAGAVPRAGLAALDPVSGRPLDWNPGRKPLGESVYALLATSEGLWVGSDTDWIGNFQYKRPKIALFPYAGGRMASPTTVGRLPGTVYLGGQRTTSQSNVLYRVNAGGPALQAIDSGPDWIDDSGASGTYRNDGSNAAAWDPVPRVDATVPTTTPSAIFDSERWDPGSDPEMEWRFPVPAGTPVEVRLYLANRCSCTSGTGQRVFSVTLDGQPWLQSEDIVADVGDQTGTMKAKGLTVPADGMLYVRFGHEVENPLVNGIEIVRTDLPTPTPSSNDTLTSVPFDGTTASAPQSIEGSGVPWGQTRGAVLVGDKLFYGATDGYLHVRPFDGSTFGSDDKLDPYHDPYWNDVRTGVDDTTFGGTLPTLYSQTTNLTGMAYASGRLYYTLAGQPALYSRWFSPDSGIVDERVFTAPSSVDFRGASGMFVSGDQLYFVQRSDGSLNRVSFSDGSVTGVATKVSSPDTDGVDWGNRSLFFRAGAVTNKAPTAAFSSSCTDLSCSFDGSASSDPDGTIGSYAWDFGDGQNSTEARPRHTYSAVGSYEVKLTVTNNGGATSTVAHSVTVSQKPVVSQVAFVGAAHSSPEAALSRSVTLPSQAKSGDTLLLLFTYASTVNFAGPTGVDGLTMVSSVTNASVTSVIWKKALVASDSGREVRVTYDTYQKGVLTAVVYSGVDAARVQASSIAGGGDSNTSTHVSPKVDARQGDVVLSYWSEKSEGTTAWSTPQSIVVRDTAIGTGSGRYSALVADSGNAVNSGTYGGLTSTTDGVSAKSAMWSIPLSPMP